MLTRVAAPPCELHAMRSTDVRNLVLPRCSTDAQRRLPRHGRSTSAPSPSCLAAPSTTSRVPGCSMPRARCALCRPSIPRRWLCWFLNARTNPTEDVYAYAQLGSAQVGSLIGSQAVAQARVAVMSVCTWHVSPYMRVREGSLR